MMRKPGRRAAKLDRRTLTRAAVGWPKGTADPNIVLIASRGTEVL